MKCIFLMAWALLPLSLLSQQAGLSGRITDAQTGLPLAGVTVILSESKTGTSTDSAGRYAFRNVPAGHTIAEVSFFGYKTIIEHLHLEGSRSHDFRMQPSIILNEGITVTAVAGATSIRRAPIPITRLNKDELLFTPSTNIIDALSRQPGVSQVGSGPAISKPVIRGLGYNRLVVINDGIRQEGQQWGDEHGIEIDENSVNRVEIVKGPASLIYGSDAMAGVINIITTVPLPQNTLGGQVIAGYGTNNRQRSFYGTLGGNRGAFNWNAWGAYKGAADYRNRYDGPVFNSKFNERNFGGYAGYNGSWGYSHLIVSRFHQQLGMVEGERDPSGRFLVLQPGGVERAAMADDFSATRPKVPYQDVQHLKVVSDNRFRLGSGRLALVAGWQQNLRTEYGNADDAAEKSLQFDLRSIHLNTAYHFDHKRGWSTSIGLSGMHQQNRNRGVEVLIPEYNLYDIGGFIYAQKDIGKTSLSGGLRYDWRTLEAEAFMEDGQPKFEAFTRRFGNVSGSVGLSYEWSEAVLLKLNLARGFRAPSMPELSSNGTHEGTNRYEYGNRGLQSESSWQGDLGLEVNSEHVRMTAGLFYNAVADYIFYTRLLGAGGTDSLVEVDGELLPAFRFVQNNARLYGGEVLVDIHPHPLDWLHWENSFSYVQGRFASAVEGVSHLPLVPAPRWISELRGEFLNDGKRWRNLAVHLELDHSFRQARAFTAYGTERPTPSYTLLHAGLSTSFMHKGKTAFTVYVLAQNITDVAYQQHLSRLRYAPVNEATGRQGVFNMGRNFVFRLQVPFSL